jgi:hypothetical protein
MQFNLWDFKTYLNSIKPCLALTTNNIAFGNDSFLINSPVIIAEGHIVSTGSLIYWCGLKLKECMYIMFN